MGEIEFDCSEFLQGQIACQNGIRHQSGRSESYDRGYSAEYALEQVLSELCAGGCDEQ